MKLFKYFKEIYKQYGMVNLLLTSILTTLIIIIIDYFNLFTLLYIKVKMPIIICCLVLFTIKLLSLKLYSLFKLKSVNYLDFYSLTSWLSVILYTVILYIYKDLLVIYSYKTIGIKFVVLFLSIILIIRYLSITIKEFTNKNQKKRNVFDLKELYDDVIPDDIEYILISDESVNYDLLQRDKIINQMTSTIANCNTDSKFVISLKGNWGSGKTTILNNVKNKLKEENLIFIDDFEPWVYGDKKSLLVAFFDKIMNNINCGFRINDINIFTKTYLKTISTNIGYSVGELLEEDINIDRIKKIINNYLESNDKRIVLVLDNLERCSRENILFILRTIHNLFDFNRIIYVLSYDETAMKKHFENNLDIDYSYLEKMIQLEFSVPTLDKSILLDVINKCVFNYLKHSKYQVDDKFINEITKLIIENVKDLRDFKRIINSTFYASFNNAKYLNSIDMLLIEIISLKNPKLWYEINKNEAYYISEDRYVYDNEYIYNTERYNQDATKYFDDLFINNKYDVNKYKDILCYLFPNVKKYFEENKYNKKEKIQFIPEHQYYGNKKEYRSSVIDKRIYNGKFFKLYFNKGENEFIRIDEKINELISYVNDGEHIPKDLLEKYFEMERIYPGWVEKYTLETFQMYLDRIKEENLLPLLRIIYSSYYVVDDSPLFFQLNAKSRTQVIIADILLMLTNEDFNKFISEIKLDYKNLYFIREISYWLKPENRHDELISQERFDAINTIYENMLIEIKEKKINMYLPENYNRFNAILLFEDEEYMEFLKKKIKKESLMLFILDCISVSTGSYGIGYNFNVDNIDKFYGWEKVKKELKKCPDSELKDFLIKAFETSSPYKSIDEKNTYHVEEWIDLNSLIIKYLNR